MNQDERVTVALGADERRIVSSLRDLPPSPLKDLSQRLILRLLDYVREPRCAEMQADGVPCERPEADCEQCSKIRELLDVLDHGLPRP